MRSLFFLLISILYFSAPLFGQSTEEKRKAREWKVEIIGNQTYTDFVIKEHIATGGTSLWQKVTFWSDKQSEFNKLVIKKDVIRIERFYERRGFFSADVYFQIVNIKDDKWKIVFIVDEGKPIRIIDVDLAFDSKRFRSTIKKSAVFRQVKMGNRFRVGARFIPALKYQVINSYKKALKKIGFAYAQVHIKAGVDTIAGAADINIYINSGPLTYVTNILVKGTETVSESFVIRESGLKIGSLYSPEAVEKAQRQLFNHPLFKFVTLRIPDQPHDSTLTLVLKVREKELRTFKASIGFSTEEYLRGKISWRHRNVFGNADLFSVSAKASFIGQFLGLNYLVPYLFRVL